MSRIHPKNRLNRHVTCVLTDDALQQLNAVAQRRGITRGEALREALEWWLKRERDPHYAQPDVRDYISNEGYRLCEEADQTGNADTAREGITLIMRRYYSRSVDAGYTGKHPSFHDYCRFFDVERTFATRFPLAVAALRELTGAYEPREEMVSGYTYWGAG